MNLLETLRCVDIDCVAHITAAEKAEVLGRNVWDDDDVYSENGSRVCLEVVHASEPRGISIWPIRLEEICAALAVLG